MRDYGCGLQLLLELLNLFHTLALRASPVTESVISLVVFASISKCSFMIVCTQVLAHKHSHMMS